ncbi:TolC family protein [Dyadobacter psychrotolerans]|uniref:TolC family protein n=1 Tax=Dyadobacter psychrotolerans TaxID=2541721 RepID=UPI0015F2CE07|nr:TolC family protein [Dyadobacter psychrotolerans]
MLQPRVFAHREAKLGLLPSLDLNVGASRAFLSKNFLNGSLSEQFVGTSYMDNFDATLQLSWDVDIWGKAKMQKEAAIANYFGQNENLSVLKTRIISQVAIWRLSQRKTADFKTIWKPSAFSLKK